MPIVDNPSAINISTYNAYWTFSPSSGITSGTGPWNAVNPLPSGANCALLNGLGTMEQSFTVPTSGTYAIAYQAQIRPWVNGTQTISIAIDGTVVSTPGGLSQFTWRTKSFNVTLAVGTHTLRFSGLSATDETMLIDSVTITGPNPGGSLIALPNGNFDSYTLAAGTYVLDPSPIASPIYRLVASASTCGKLAYCRLIRISDGDAVNSGTINQAPTLTINGVSRGPLATAGLCSTDSHLTWMVPMPSGVTISASDAVSLSAPAGWIFGPSGYAESMSGQIITNRAGRSFVRTVDVPRTMKIGAAFSHYSTPEWRNGFVTKNQRYRCAYWNPTNVSTDSGGKPIVMAATAAYAPLVWLSEFNNIDATVYPTPTGLWGVPWDDLDGGTAFSLSALGDPNGSVIEVGSVSVAISGGTRRFKVYNCQATGTPKNFQLWLRLDKADKNPHFDNLAILAPGDFTWTTGQTTIPPMPTFDELPAVLTAKIPTSVSFSGFRYANAGIKLGDSAACERDHVVEPGDFHWAQDVKTANQIRYTSARPWSAAVSPYIYDPLAGTPFDCTLSVPIATTPAAGTLEVITISDAATAPVLPGLVLAAGSERMPVKAVSGTAVTVLRGGESTTPATHAAGTISVSGRRSVAGLASFGNSNMQIAELVTQSPHGLKSGQIVPMQGQGWPPFTYTDGRGFSGTWFNPYFFPVYVTGGSTFVVLTTGPSPSNPSNTTLSTTYTLDPANCSSLLYLPEYGGNPYELVATTAAKYPGGAAWVTFPNAASDDMVDAIWRDRILPNLPADRDAWVELGDEPWNFASRAALYWNGMDWMVHGLTGTNTYWYANRVGQIKQRGAAIWTAAGRDPSHIKSSINVQTVTGTAGNIGSVLNFCSAHGVIPDAVAIAPYYDFYHDGAFYKAFAAWDTDMLVDAWIWDFYDNTSSAFQSQSAKLGAFRSAINTWNSANAGSVGLIIYEYGPEKPWPHFQSTLASSMDSSTATLVLSSGVASNVLSNLDNDALKVQPGTWLNVDNEWMKVVSRSGSTCTVTRGQGGTTAASHSGGATVRNDWIEGIRDLTLHPNFRIAHYDSLALFQSYGVSLCMPSALDQTWSGANAWADYHAIAQPPGKGDGSDGKANNLLCLARRGQTNSKSATVNQDTLTVSVRGQAMIDFLTPIPSSAGRKRFISRRPVRALVR